jgi:uridine kinase
MFIIGIAGGTGSGKTTLVERIKKMLPAGVITVVPQDAYYKDNSHVPADKREEINFDHPSALEFSLLTDHLKRLKNGESVRRPVYSYITCTRSPETLEINPCRILILEGILILSDPELRDILDLKIFVDADADDRLGRVIARDISERGRTVDKVLERYHKSVKPMHLQFIEPSKRFADIIIPGGGENYVAIELIKDLIGQRLRLEEQ